MSTHTHHKLVELDVDLAAPKDRVWQALTGEIDAWWLGDFRVVAPDSTLSLDARAGGLLLEAKPDGGSLVWFTVQMVEPGTALHLVGHIAPPWGGPCLSMLSLTLVETEAGTRLEIRDALIGPETITTSTSLDAGWRALFGQGLKAHVEG